VTADATPNVTVFMGSGGGIGTTWLEPTPADVARVLHVLEGAITEDQLSQAMHVEWLYNRAQLIQGVGNYSLLFTNLGIERTRIDLLQPVVAGLVHDVELLDYAVNTQLNALYQANQDHSETLFDHEERLESQTSRIIQAEDKITLHVGQIKSLDDGLTETNANIGIVADAINLTVSQNAIDADNRMSASENSILLNTEAIALRVTAHEETYQRVSDTLAEIAVERARITSNVESVEVLQGEMITANSNITQTAQAIFASIETINEAQGTIDQATLDMTALGATLTASTEALNDATNVVASSQSQVSNKWSVDIREDINGKRYATGFGLTLAPDWAIGKTYKIGDRVFYDNKVWDSQAPHVGNALLNPIPDNHDYWIEYVNGMKTEFSIEADSFFLYSPNGNHVSPFSVSGDTMQINASVTFASPSTVRTQLNVADGADVTASVDLAAQINNATTTISGGKITTGSITSSHIASRTIAADRIAAGVITANEIAGGTITGGHIAGRTIAAGNIVADAITATEIWGLARINGNRLMVAASGSAYLTAASPTRRVDHGLGRYVVITYVVGAYGTWRSVWGFILDYTENYFILQIDTTYVDAGTLVYSYI